MNVLIVAATEAEIKPFRDYLNGNIPVPEGKAHRRGTHIVVTGVGMVATAYVLTKHLQSNKYDFVIQAGVAGSYDRNIPPGSVVFVSTDEYGDTGAEDHEQYLDIFEMGLAKEDEFPFSGGKLVVPSSPVHEAITLPRVGGLTVNMVSGNERTIKHRSGKYQCTVESMEGAAFHEVCLRENVPFAQIRAVSNYVVPRDKSQWKMKDAIINLNNWLIDFVNRV